jgi:hypothetical protein
MTGIISATLAVIGTGGIDSDTPHLRPFQICIFAKRHHMLTGQILTII